MWPSSQLHLNLLGAGNTRGPTTVLGVTLNGPGFTGAGSENSERDEHSDPFSAMRKARACDTGPSEVVPHCLTVLPSCSSFRHKFPCSLHTEAPPAASDTQT